MDDMAERVRDSMSQIEFQRWQILMRKIERNNERRQDLQNELYKLQRESNHFYIEMRRLWEFCNKNRSIE